MIDNQELLKISGNYYFWGNLRGAKLPAEKWVFIRRSLIFRVGGKNKCFKISRLWIIRKKKIINQKH
jgi:hypothetical protein